MSEFDIRQIKLGEDVTAEAIHEDLEFLDDWEERYRYIIDLGKQLPAMPEDLRTEERFVRGCQSQVWLLTDYDEDQDRLYLAVESDAVIVRGLAAIILAALMVGKRPDIHVLVVGDPGMGKSQMLTAAVGLAQLVPATSHPNGVTQKFSA